MRWIFSTDDKDQLRRLHQTVSAMTRNQFETWLQQQTSKIFSRVELMWKEVIETTPKLPPRHREAIYQQHKRWLEMNGVKMTLTLKDVSEDGSGDAYTAAEKREMISIAARAIYEMMQTHELVLTKEEKIKFQHACDYFAMMEFQDD